jgi:hypothetical protein
MLTNKSSHDEIKLMEDVIAKAKDPVAGATLKALTLVIKLLLNIRTNQVLLMKHEGIKLEEKKPTEGIS